MSHVAHRELPIPAGGLVVSCQSPPGNPLQGPQLMAAFARAAEYGGAMAIRANGPADVAAIRAATDLPVIGINKTGSRQGVYITPTPATAAEVVAAGAAMVAVDGTDRPRPQGWTLPALVDVIHHEFGVPVMADCDSMASAAYAPWPGTPAIMPITPAAPVIPPITAATPAPPSIPPMTPTLPPAPAPTMVPDRTWTCWPRWLPRSTCR